MKMIIIATSETVPHWMNGELSRDSLTLDQPVAATLSMAHAVVCITASITTTRPIHLWNRLKVSKETLSIEINGLFLPAIKNRAIMLRVAR